MKLGDAEVTLPCPQCGHSFQVRLSATAEGSRTRCPRCGVLFKGNGDDLASAQRALDDLKKSFRKLGGS